MNLPAFVAAACLGGALILLPVVLWCRPWPEDQPEDDRPGDDDQFAQWPAVRIGGDR